MKKHTGKIWRGLATTTASLLTITLGGSSIANARVDFINATLGTSSYKIEQGDSDSDGIYYESEFDNVEDLVKAKEQLAAEISSEGSVLFKNTDQTLPLDKSKEAVTLWGLNSHLPGTGGLIGSSVVAGSGDGQIAYGIEEAMDERGFTVNETMKGFYASETCAPYYRKASFFGNEVPGHSLVPAFSASYNEADTYTVGEAPAELYTDDILESAKDTTAIVVLSRDSSEASDYSKNMKDPNGDSFDTPMSISAYEKEMIQLAKENSNGKVIVLINSDVPMEIQKLKDDPEIGAILWTGLPGMNGFLGVCDVLSGDVNPSGHISDTYATSSVSAPAMTNFGLYTYTNASNAESGAELTEADKGDWYVVETEGIYIGYKYYETRYEDTVLDQGNAATTEGSSTGKAWNYVDEVTYPFGYGLSYTTFTQELESVDVISGEKGLAKVKVTNTGDVAGKDVVQLYVQTPYIEGGLEKASIQLLDFGKTEVLEPGESQTLEIEFAPEYMASYDEKAVKEADLVIGCVLIPGKSAPKIFKKKYLKEMKPGAVFVDVAVDQGGCGETTKVTYHDDPIFIEDGVVHYCVGNMPGAVPRTSTIALTNATLSYGLQIAGKGLEQACKDNEVIYSAVNTYDGKLTCKNVADSFDCYEYTDIRTVC